MRVRPTLICLLVRSLIVFFSSAGLAIRAFWKQRNQFSEMLRSTNSGLSLRRYFRLMALAGTEITFALPFGIYMLVSAISVGVSPWLGWADTHLNFNRWEKYPLGLFKLYPSSWAVFQVNRFVLPLAGILFFGFLGMSGESGAFYKRVFWRAATKVGIPEPTNTSITGASSWYVHYLLKHMLGCSPAFAP